MPRSFFDTIVQNRFGPGKPSGSITKKKMARLIGVQTTRRLVSAEQELEEEIERS
jgi:hypothetical protein